VSANRTRGLLRAAALLAVGASPLLVTAASAAEAPRDVIDDTVGGAPQLVGSVSPATDLLSGKPVTLPAPLPDLGSQLPSLPQLDAAPKLPEAPAAPQLPQTPDTRALTALPNVPGVPAELPQVSQLPQVPQVPALPAPTLG
jgi:hypothetical protein